MKYSRLASVTLLFMLSAGLRASLQPAPKSTPVQGSGGATFTYSSTAEPATGGFKLHNVIVNTSGRNYLAVKWEDGRVIAVGSQQLGPGDSAFGPDVIVENPTLVHNSAIRYGAALQYEHAADVHIEPVARDRVDSTKELAPAFTSRMVRQKADGPEWLHLTVMSRLNADRTGSELSIDMPKGWSLLLPRPFSTGLSFASLSGAQSMWKSSEQAIQTVLSNPDLSRAAQDWLRTNAPVTLLENPAGGGAPAAQIVGRFAGTAWESVRVPVLAFPPSRDGFVGTLATLHRARPRTEGAR
jgi:hypothetical protein